MLGTLGAQQPAAGPPQPVGQPAPAVIQPAGQPALPPASQATPSTEGPRQAPPPPDANKVDDLLNLDIDQLAKVRVGGAKQTNLTAPSNQLNAGAADVGEVTSTGELLTQAPGVSARRISAINLDPRVRGYNSSQLNASANGMTELKTRLDIDSVFSQIDPGIVADLTIIDGPYTSLYGPGFAFLAADLLPAPRFQQPEAHAASTLVFGSNGSTLYNRDNILAGGTDWGAVFSYGYRSGDDYLTGGRHPYYVPSAYEKWDTLLSVSGDVHPGARLQFDYVRTEMNNVLLPGVVYDLDQSTNQQFNLRYLVQEDPKGPRELVLQSWFSQTPYHGDAARASKQQTLYEQFFTLADYGDYPNQIVNTVGQGRMQTLGVRALRTFGAADSPQWTVGADFRRVNQWYQEEDLTTSGGLGFGNGLFGIPRSQMDDFGLLTDVLLPVRDDLSVTIGGRLDYCKATLDESDAIVTQMLPPAQQGPFWCGTEEPGKLLGMAYLTGSYHPAEHYTLRAGTGFAMRMPDLAELYSFDPYVPFARFGNSYVDGLSLLQPEQDLQFDLGLTYETKRFAWGVRGFYAFVHDYILPVPEGIMPAPPWPQVQAPHVLGRNFSDFPAQFRQDINTPNENADTCQANYQYVNLSQATLGGGDLFAQATLWDGVTLFGSMSYVNGTNCAPVQFVASPADNYAPAGHLVHLGGTEGLPGIYPLTGTVGVRLFESTADRWLLEFSARMVAHQEHVAGSLSEIPTPGFAVFGLRGYYRVQKNIRLTLDLENLFNKLYSEPDSLAIIGPGGIPTFLKEPGFSALVGLDARF
jgi:outer membrane receptor protein involved in Fe transport